MKTIAEVLQLAAQFLEDHAIDKARRHAEELLAFVLQMKRMDLYLQFDRPLEERELVPLRALLKRRAKGEPLEYVIGAIDFCNCRIALSPAVLIPRQETEILTDLIIKQLSALPLEGRVMYDLCTGSGYIGIALKKAFEDLEVVLVDLSADALRMAEQNAAANGAAVRIVEGDFLDPAIFRKKADFVVCNPPYISADEYLHIDASVRDFEPKEALLGGERGTEFYERLAVELPPHLNSGARVFLEIGALQGRALTEIFSGGPWARIELKKDWAGLDRFFFLEKDAFLH